MCPLLNGIDFHTAVDHVRKAVGLAGTQCSKHRRDGHLSLRFRRAFGAHF